MSERTTYRLIFGLCAAVWATFAVLQIALPGHTLSIPWLVLDVMLAALLTFLAVRS